jgi:hypothetical protein
MEGCGVGVGDVVRVDVGIEVGIGVGVRVGVGVRAGINPRIDGPAKIKIPIRTITTRWTFVRSPIVTSFITIFLLPRIPSNINISPAKKIISFTIFYHSERFFIIHEFYPA